MYNLTIRLKGNNISYNIKWFCFLLQNIMNINQRKKIIRNIALNGIMLAVLIALQAVSLPNIITGIFVNCILVFLSIFSGIKSSIILCLLSPFCALLTGHLPPYMLPVLPMIALGNCFMVYSFFKLSQKSLFIKLLIPSIIKALIIIVGGFLMIKIFLPDRISDFIVISMLGIQLFTAISGIWLGTELSKKFEKYK